MTSSTARGRRDQARQLSEVLLTFPAEKGHQTPNHPWGTQTTAQSCTREGTEPERNTSDGLLTGEGEQSAKSLRTRVGEYDR